MTAALENEGREFERPTASTQRLERLLDQARKHLIEIGTRNRLVHTNRKAKRPATLPVSHGDPDVLCRRLTGDGVGFRFVADVAATERERRRTAENDSDENPDEPAEDGVAALAPPSGGDVLVTRLGEAGLQKKLTGFARESKTLEEEQGINILFLAIGFLRWFEEEGSEVEREAPLILVPVSLVRDARRSTYSLKAREEDIVTNLPLSERLRDQEGLLLPDIPEDEDWCPSEYFDAVVDAVSTRPRWSIDRRGLELGFFSFAKFLMYRDLSAGSWPNSSVLSHPLLRGLLQDGFPSEEPLFADNVKIDERFTPSDLIHVLDADGSQTLAIETARAGRNLVVHGPPGTGKSQTIANVIAAAANDGKSVLFIAEKMVALDVVYNRLKKAELGPLCLELHSRMANKRSVCEELDKTLAAGAAEPDFAENTARLIEARDTLNEIASDLHTPIANTGTSAFAAIADLVRAHGIGRPPPRISVSAAVNWTFAEYQTICATVERYTAITDVSGPVTAHPWRGVRNRTLQPPDLQRLELQGPDAADAFEALNVRARSGALLMESESAITLARVAKLSHFLELLAAAPSWMGEALGPLNTRSVSDLDHTEEVLREAARLVSDISAETQTFLPPAFNADTANLRARLEAGARSLLKRWGRVYRAASKELATYLTCPLPKSARERLALVDRLISLKSQYVRFDQLSEEARALLGPLWHDRDTDFPALILSVAWFRMVRSEGFSFDLAPGIALVGRPDLLNSFRTRLAQDETTARAALESIFRWLDLDVAGAFSVSSIEEVGLSELGARVNDWTAATARYREWCEIDDADRTLRSFGLAQLADSIAAGSLTPQDAIEELRYARAEVLWQAARERNPRLTRLQATDRTALVETFRRLESERLLSVAALVRARHAAQVPRGFMGDMGVIRGEIARRRGHMPIRKLMQRVGRTIQKIKPVFLMSPISVAQFLPPGTVEFDLLVIDEASQVRPEDALGVVARAKQIVVVGDSKQLPPTNFFSRLLSDGDENDGDEDAHTANDGLAGAAKAAELESILTLCEARGVGSKMLRWHYRSKHPSLIEVSNEAFYDRGLFLPPSPATDRQSDGLALVRVEGAYDRGGKRTNEIEAKAIVDALVNHAEQHPRRSIGIVTFSQSQRDLIANLIDYARQHSTVLDNFLDAANEETFVKNLENVQGDERDHIIVSVGYGPRQPGARLDSMHFGPVSADGGQRRLNVLFTRARYRCDVFCSFDPSDIDTERAASEGARILQRYLAYAETGILDRTIVAAEDYDSPFRGGRCERYPLSWIPCGPASRNKGLQDRFRCPPLNAAQPVHTCGRVRWGDLPRRSLGPRTRPASPRNPRIPGLAFSSHLEHRLVLQSIW